MKSGLFFIKDRPQFNEKDRPSDNELKQLWTLITKNKLVSKGLDLSYIQILRESSKVICLFEALETSTLQHINLSETCISEEYIKHVSNMLTTNKTLQGLNLSGNFIGNRGIYGLKDALKTNESLKCLDLSQSEFWMKAHKHKLLPEDFTSEDREYCLPKFFISNIGAKCLAEVLKTNRSLHTLDLRYHGIADEGATALLEALQGEHGNHSLTTLALEGNFIDKKILEQIETCLERNRKISFKKGTELAPGTELVHGIFASTVTEKTTMRVMPKPIAEKIWSELEDILSPGQKITMILIAKEKEKEKREQRGKDQEEQQATSRVGALKKESAKKQKHCVIF